MLHASTKRGFALVLALSLMAFVLLLLLSITALTRVSTVNSNQLKLMHQAQANAFLGLNVALGELQEYAGLDRRTTAYADIAARNVAGDRLGAAQDPANDNTLSSKSKGLSRLAQGTRYWTGVWEDRNLPDDIYKATPEPQLLTWLVSGNENGALNFSPDLGVSVTSADHKIPLANNREAVVLVGNHSVGSASSSNNYFQNFGLSSPQSDDVESAQDRYVIAPLVEFESGNQSGAYAFWVGDEGVKARYNLVDDYADATTVEKIEFRARSAPRVAAEIATASDLAQPASSGALTDFSNTPDYVYDDYPFPGGSRSSQTVASLKKVDSMTTAGLVQFVNSGDADQRFVKRFHSLTTLSQGLLTNSQSGGLKQDLSLALEDAATYSAMFPSDRVLPAQYSPTTGPNWSTIKAFYDLADRNQDAINLDDPTLTGVSPTITELRLLFKLFPNRVTDHWEIRTSVAIGIANPYSVPLTTSGLTMKFDRLGRLEPGSDIYNGMGTKDQKRGAWWLWALEDSTSGLTDATILSNQIETFKLTDTAVSDGRPTTGMLTHADTSFSIPSTTWPPGQMKLFAVANRNQVLDSSSAITAINLKLISNAPLETHYFSYDTGVSLPTGDIAPDPDNGIAGTKYDAWVHAYDASARWGEFGNKPIGFAVELYSSSASAPLVRIDPLTFYTAHPIVPLVNHNVDFEGGIVGGTLHLYLALPHMGIDKREAYTFRPFIDHNLRAAWQPPAPFGRGSHPTGNKIGSQFPYAGRRTATSQSYTDSLGSSFSGHWLWGGSFTNTDTAKNQFTLYDLPRRVSQGAPPLFSIAQLQHVDLTADDRATSVGYQSGLAAGNSFHAPLISRELAIVTRTADSYNPYFNLRFFDISYLLNAKLFDGYFFSSFPGGALDDDLPNQRMKLGNPSSFFNAAANEIPGSGSAASLRLEGAFNVNSTSPEAWASVLASSIRVPVNGDDPGKGTAFARSLNQSGTSEQASHGNTQDSYNGYRRLTDSEVREIAWQIVKQVRQRGPFTSLSHFVNRALVPAAAGTSPAVPPASWGLSGALQSAIDSTAINDLPGLISDWVEPIPSGVRDGLESPFWPDASIDYPVLLASTSAQERPLYGNSSTGIPGILTQADVLQVLGASLSARSDTFRIRAYGEAKGLDGSSTANSWCEAIVQRIPDYIDITDAPGVAPNNLSSNQNQQFGRRFKIVSFRWLQEDEI